MKGETCFGRSPNSRASLTFVSEERLGLGYWKTRTKGDRDVGPESATGRLYERSDVQCQKQEGQQRGPYESGSRQVLDIQVR